MLFFRQGLGATVCLLLLLALSGCDDISTPRGVVAVAYNAAARGDMRTLHRLLAGAARDRYATPVGSRELVAGLSPGKIVIGRASRPVVDAEAGVERSRVVIAQRDTTGQLTPVRINRVACPSNTGGHCVILEVLSPRAEVGELLEAIRADDTSHFVELLNLSVDINAAGDDGVTPLMQTIDSGRYDMFRILLNLKADVNAHDALGSTALSRAQTRGDFELVTLLKQAGAH